MLVVEDHDGLRLALEHGLRAEGFAVDTCASAEQAYELVVEIRPRVVVLDWTLPGGDDGTEACRKLIDRHPAGRVVMFTGRDDPQARCAALGAGAAGYISKGVGIEHLAAELRDHATAA